MKVRRTAASRKILDGWQTDNALGVTGKMWINLASLRKKPYLRFVVAMKDSGLQLAPLLRGPCL